MKELTQEMIERFYDGELSAKEAKRVEAALAETPELRQSLKKLEKMSELLCLMNEETLADVSFEGFADRVTRGIEQGQRPGVLERISVWLKEFFEHKRSVWVPAAAVAAAAVALVIAVPFIGGEKPRAYPPDPRDRQIFEASHPAGPSAASSAIESVVADAGEATVIQYEVSHGSQKIGVAWVMEQE